MTGGRGMTDIRDFPQDAPAPVQTLPKRYGVRRTAVFTGVMLFVSFIIGICIPYTGRVGAGYLWFAVPFVIIGSASAVAFIIKPSPRLAHVFTYVCMMGLGTLICAAMIAGHLTG